MDELMYDAISDVYDEINGDLDYGSWADFICRLFEEHRRTDIHDVLDLACGTGRMTVELARRGYSMVGVDLSPEMLSKAGAAAASAGLSDEVLLLCQDMCDFELYGTVEAAVCCLDSLNHITDTKKFRRCLELLHNYISPGGLLVFDLNTERKFKEVYGNNAYVFECGDSMVVWQNFYNEKRSTCDFVIDLFSQLPDGSYERSSQLQRERLWRPKMIDRLCREIGFEIVAVYGGTDLSPLTEYSERAHYLLRRI